METLISATKRKKRKTRKCLDEIRKRSRRNTDESDSFKTSLTSPVGSKRREVENLYAVKSNNNSLTSNRLTLPMFPKLIRSETITRPISDNKTIRPEIVFSKIVNDKILPSTVTSSSLKIQTSPNSDSDFITNSHEEGSIKTVFDKCNEMEKISLRRESGSGFLRNRNANSPGSFLLFSPMDQSADSDRFEQSINGETMSSHTTLSSQSSREDYGYNLYEEFMSEIPTYLKESTPALIKDDIIKKTKTILHSMYIESCRRECEDNILQCIKSSVLTNHRPFTSRGSIVQNPMDYIRLGYTWRHNGLGKLNGNGTRDHSKNLCTSMTSSNGGGIPIKVNGSMDNGNGSSVSIKLNSCEPGVIVDNCSMPPSEPSQLSVHPGHSLIHDTPEYTYYPHKLNQ